MFLKSQDLNGSILDKPEYLEGFDENSKLFDLEVCALKECAPGKAGWKNVLFYFKIYKGKEGYRIALPIKWLPVEVKGYEVFEDYLLSKTVFPNRYQAGQVASNVVMSEVGY